MLPVSSFDTYSQQLNNIQNQISQLKGSPLIPSTTPIFNQQQPIITQLPQQIDYVDGIAGAKEYQSKMLSNSTAVVMDKNSDTFYICSKDANGESPKRMPFSHFSLEYESDELESKYITKQDFDIFQEKIIALLSANKPETKSKKKEVIQEVVDEQSA